MFKFLTILEIIVCIILLLCILLQHRASGLSATFGGTGAINIQRRGAEKLIYRLSIGLGIAFLLIPILLWYVF